MSLRTRVVPRSPTTEREFLRQITDLGKILGWRVYHPFLSKWSEPGYPDLTLVRPPRLIFAELKTDRGKVSEAQADWLALLGQCAETYLWRPADLDAIATVLR